MLVQLSIRDIVLIDRLDLSFRSGLSVLTGETGAGKSILLDGFALALGGRGDGSLVRHGETQGQVSAVFDLPIIAYNLSQGQFPRVRIVKSYKPVISGSVGIGVRKTDGELLKKINAGLAKLKADGTVDKILAKWGLV